MTRILTPLAAILLLAFAAGAELPDRIIMPHRTHFENDVECALCHEGVEASTTAAESHRPDMEVCAACHDVEDDTACAMCHTNVDEAGEYAVRTYGAERFAHAAHAAVGIVCAACHGDPAVADPVLPAKPDCRACHETADAYGDCRVCHDPVRELKPASHTVGWDVGHGGPARDDAMRCAGCHTQTTCQECHAGDNVRPRSHTLNFAYDHASKARGNELDCAVCHTEAEFCTSCHAQYRILPDSHSRVGWVRPGDGGRHAVDGAFEVESCIACHGDGPTAPGCAACHGG